MPQSKWVHNISSKFASIEQTNVVVIISDLEPLNIYCKSCEDAVCMTCTMTSEHEGHELVKAEEECGAIKVRDHVNVWE